MPFKRKITMPEWGVLAKLSDLMSKTTSKQILGSDRALLREQLCILAFKVDHKGVFYPAHREAYIGLLSKKFEDTSFIVGDSPATLDVNAALGRNSIDGYVVCDGAGNITVKHSCDGSNYGDAHTLQKNEVYSFLKLDIDTIIITHSGTDSAYRVMVI